MMSRSAASERELHLVALFEGLKGVLILLAGFGILALIHKNLHHVAAQLIQQFHINPARHYPTIFLDLVDRLTVTRLWALAAGAATYAAARIIEAFGLWFHRRWALWFGIISGGIYIPWELYELIRGVTWPKVVLLLVNVAVVSILVPKLRENRGEAG